MTDGLNDSGMQSVWNHLIHKLIGHHSLHLVSDPSDIKWLLATPKIHEKTFLQIKPIFIHPAIHFLGYRRKKFKYEWKSSLQTINSWFANVRGPDSRLIECSMNISKSNPLMSDTYSCITIACIFIVVVVSLFWCFCLHWIQRDSSYHMAHIK